MKIYLEEKHEEEQKSNEILIKGKDKNKIKNKKEIKIIEENEETFSAKEEKNNTKKSELIKEPEGLFSTHNKNKKENTNDSSQLISEKIKLKGKKIFSEDNDENKKYIQIQIN